MKHCPRCQRTYADETLNFCLDDGTPLQSAPNSSLGETLVLDPNEPPPTEILDPARAATVRPHKPAATVPQQPARHTRNEFENLNVAPAPARRNTTSVVALTVIATILLLALGGLGAWLLLRDRSDKTGEGAIDAGRGSNTSNTGQTGGNTATSNTNVNVTRPSATPTATPVMTPLSTPQPTPTITPSSARREVAEALEGWRQTMVNPDVDAHMRYYADTLHTYYNASNVSSARVRENVARAFSNYSTFEVWIANLQIEVDPSGQKAVATFEKSFVFSRGEKRYTGAGPNRFWFEKIGGRWLITGEKDINSR